jgi:uncharacterized membrane-anchored protein YitT (DUF2179 family)
MCWVLLYFQLFVFLNSSCLGFCFFAGNELVFTVLALVVVLTVISTLEPFLPRSADHSFTNDDE